MIMHEPLDPPGLPAPAGGGRVLVVDDNPDAADTLAELLRLVGYEVRCAGDGRAALEMLDDFRPQAALLDIGLPGIDGYELAGMLRADPRAAGIKLAALTGYGSDEDRVRALEAGFDQHLVKPVTAQQLFDVLAGMLPGGSA